MTLETLGLVVAAVSAGAAVFAAISAAGANRRARMANENAARANETAARALDFQAKVDAREREHRDVEWLANWADDVPEDSPPIFTLKNEGLTRACGVTLVIHLPFGRQVHEIGDVEPGQLQRVTIKSTLRGPVGAAVLELHGRVFHVFWSSPLGQAEDRFYPGSQMFA